jgi:GTP-binding protein
VVDITHLEGEDDPAIAARKVIHELEKRGEGLADKPRWLALNKIDSVPHDELDAICNHITA